MGDKFTQAANCHASQCLQCTFALLCALATSNHPKKISRLYTSKVHQTIAALLLGLILAGCSTSKPSNANTQAHRSQPRTTLPGSAAQQQAPLQSSLLCQVTGVQCGDPMTRPPPGQAALRVRLDQIDAPEKAQPFGSAAKKHLSGKVFGKTVLLKVSGTDRYGRTLAEIYLDDININKEMVRDGYAWSYTQYVRDPQYNSLQAQAQSEQRGLWADPAPVYPSHFRRSKRPATATGLAP